MGYIADEPVVRKEIDWDAIEKRILARAEDIFLFGDGNQSLDAGFFTGCGPIAADQEPTRVGKVWRP